MRRFVRAALALAAIVTPTLASAQAKPVIGVLYFDNNSFGKDAADYNGVGKGMAELMINAMAQNAAYRVVERERIQALLVEQNLIKEKTIDPQTAVRLGRIIGAQYMIYGAFMKDPSGRYVLTAKSVNVETSAISNPMRVDTRGDDVLAMIDALVNKVNTEMKLPALQVGQASAPGAVPAGQPATQRAAEPSKVAETKTTPAPSKPATQVAQNKPARKLDMKTAMLYSKALEAEDAGNKSQAVELYKKVQDAFPDYAPVQNKIKKLTG